MSLKIEQSKNIFLKTVNFSAYKILHFYFRKQNIKTNNNLPINLVYLINPHYSNIKILHVRFCILVLLMVTVI